MDPEPQCVGVHVGTKTGIIVVEEKKLGSRRVLQGLLRLPTRTERDSDQVKGVDILPHPCLHTKTLHQSSNVFQVPFLTEYHVHCTFCTPDDIVSWYLSLKFFGFK